MIASHANSMLWWALAGVAALAVPGATGVWRDGVRDAPNAAPSEILAVVEGTDDLGVIGHGATHFSHEVKIRNNGGTVANILGLQTGCGCMDASVSPSRLAPGETARIVMTLRVAPGTKDFHKAIALRTDVPGAPVVTIPLHGRVGPGLSVWPHELRLEPVTASELPVLADVFVSGAAGSIQTTSGKGFLTTEQVAHESGKYRVRVAFNRSDPGKFEDVLFVKDAVTGVEKSISVLGEVLPDVHFNPESVVFVEGASGGKKVDVDIAWSGLSGPLASIEAPAGFTVSPSPGERPERLQIALDSATWPERDAGRVSLTTSEGNTYHLPVYVMTGL